MGRGFNEPVYCGLNEPLAKLVRFYCKPSVTVLMLVKRNVSYIAAGFEASVTQALCFYCIIFGSSGYWGHMNQFTGANEALAGMVGF